MNRTGAVPLQKEQLRRHFLARRDAVEPALRERASAKLCQRLAGLELLSKAQVVAGYMALGNEIDLGPYLRSAKDQGQCLVLPRVIAPGVMEFCVLNHWDELRPGAFGIFEPSGAAVDADQIDIFLVPGIVFDRWGHRLGFGQGYYDRVLPAQAQSIGVGYDWQIRDEELPVEPHDRGMKYIATDQRWLRPSDHIHRSQEPSDGL